MQTDNVKPHTSATSWSAALLALLVMGSLACTALPLVPGSKPTPTPAGQTNALETTPTASAAQKKDWQVWQGSIVSQTSREYMINGSVVNSCQTDWETDFEFTIDPVGDIYGVGSAQLKSGPTCSPHPIPNNTNYLALTLQGRKDASAIHLGLGGTGVIRPMPSADFGGYFLLTSNGACPPVKQSLAIPLTGPSTAQAQLDLSGIMTGCAGSKDDLMRNQSQVSLEQIGKCSDNPFAPNDPNAIICR